MIQLIKFVVVGVFNTILGYGVMFSCMYIVGLSAVTSNVIGYLCGLVLSYTLNRKVTFKGTAKSRAEVVRFLLVFLVAYFSNLGVLMILIHSTVFPEWMSQIFAGVVYVFMSFFMNKYYVFRYSAE